MQKSLTSPLPSSAEYVSVHKRAGRTVDEGALVWYVLGGEVCHRLSACNADTEGKQRQVSDGGQAIHFGSYPTAPLS